MLIIICICFLIKIASLFIPYAFNYMTEVVLVPIAFVICFIANYSKAGNIVRIPVIFYCYIVLLNMIYINIGKMISKRTAQHMIKQTEEYVDNLGYKLYHVGDHDLDRYPSKRYESHYEFMRMVFEYNKKREERFKILRAFWRNFNAADL